jgi:hypothetical protein
MGYLDSLAVVALTAHLETTYNITLSEQELFDPRMSTAAGIAEIIASHAPASPSATGPTPLAVRIQLEVADSGSHGPVVNSWSSTSRASMPCLAAVDR